MIASQRIEVIRKLERYGQVKVGKDLCTIKGGLIHVKTETPPRHPFDGYLLENPMTWDTFEHLYLLGK